MNTQRGSPCYCRRITYGGWLRWAAEEDEGDVQDPGRKLFEIEMAGVLDSLICERGWPMTRLVGSFGASSICGDPRQGCWNRLRVTDRSRCSETGIPAAVPEIARDF